MSFNFKDRKFLGAVAALVLATTVALFQNCGSGGGGGGGGSSPALKSMPPGLGTFIDAPVAGVSYSTSSGLTGVTNALGQFQFNPGDTVTFYALGVQLGAVAPTIANDGTATITPVTLVPGATNVSNSQVTQIAQFLNTLNAISVSTGGGATGTFVVPTSTSLQTQLGTLNSSANNITQTQLQAAIDAAFGKGVYSVTPAATAQNALQSGIYAGAIAGTVWSGTCTCGGGAVLYFQSNGVISGITNDGYTISGSWSVDSSGNVSFQGTTTTNGYGKSGVITAGSSTGTLQIYQQNGTYQGVLNLSKVVSGGTVTNSSWVGTWVVQYTPNAYGISLGDSSGGCANLVASATSFYGVTNDGKYFTGSVASNGDAATSFPNGNGSTNYLNFNLGNSYGTVTQNGQVKGTLSFSQSGTCTVTKNNGGGNMSPTPGPNGTPIPTPGPNPTSTPTPTAVPTATPVPTPTPFTVGQQVHLFINWANTTNSAISIAVELKLFNAANQQVGDTVKSESSNSTNKNGTPIQTQDDIVAGSNQSPVTWQIGTGVSPCTLSPTSGSVSQGTVPAVTINCN